VLASPCLVVESDGVRIVNPLRVHWIPFGALDSVTVRGLTSVTARLGSGQLRSITSWNAPGVPRRYVAETAPVANLIERSRNSWEHRGGGPHATAVLLTELRWRPAVALLVLVAANIAIWFR
jgi:hypothetical protein